MLPTHIYDFLKIQLLLGPQKSYLCIYLSICPLDNALLLLNDMFVNFGGVWKRVKKACLARMRNLPLLSYVVWLRLRRQREER